MIGPSDFPSISCQPISLLCCWLSNLETISPFSQCSASSARKATAQWLHTVLEVQLRSARLWFGSLAGSVFSGPAPGSRQFHVHPMSTEGECVRGRGGGIRMKHAKASGNIVTTQHNQSEVWPQWDFNVLSFQSAKTTQTDRI